MTLRRPYFPHRRVASVKHFWIILNEHMPTSSSRLIRERRTMQAMLEIYCHGHHQTAGTLCAQCDTFLAYAIQRIEKCPFHDTKPTCRKCPVHCYKNDMREMARTIMGYAGPRMLIYHPVLTVSHYMDEIFSTSNPKLKNHDPE